jgi:hypothetical protein
MKSYESEIVLNKNRLKNFYNSTVSLYIKALNPVKNAEKRFINKFKNIL